MPFDDNKYDRSAVAGEIGYNVYVVGRALKRVVEAVDKLARANGIDLSDDLRSITDDIKILDDEFDRLTGWKPK